MGGDEGCLSDWMGLWWRKGRDGIGGCEGMEEEMQEKQEKKGDKHITVISLFGMKVKLNGLVMRAMNCLGGRYVLPSIDPTCSIASLTLLVATHAPRGIYPTKMYPQSQRTVTFSPETTISHPKRTATVAFPLCPAPVSSPSLPILPAPQCGSTGQPKVSDINSRLRRRSSHSSPLSAPPIVSSATKIGLQ